ncbi:hypothetical protein [Nostoc phage Nsp-JY21]
MSYTQAHLDNLREMAASGVTEASYDGKTIKYRSLEELQKAIAMIERAMGLARRGQNYPGFRRFGR